MHVSQVCLGAPGPSSWDFQIQRWGRLRKEGVAGPQVLQVGSWGGLFGVGITLFPAQSSDSSGTPRLGPGSGLWLCLMPGWVVLWGVPCTAGR